MVLLRKAALLSAASLLLLSLADFRFRGRDPEFIPPVVSGPCAAEKDAALDYLLSLDGAELKVGEHDIRYSSVADARAFEKVEPLADAGPDGGYYRFEVLYVKLLDMMRVTATLHGADGEGLGSETFYGYPFLREDGNADVRLDTNGAAVLFSDVFDYATLEEKDLEITVPIIYGGGGYVPHVLHLTYCVTSLDFEGLEGLAEEFFPTPSILESGFEPYLLHRFKADLAFSDYEHNEQQNQNLSTSGCINNQQSLANWRFGLDSFGLQANLAAAGCGCVAVYNLLFDSYLSYSDVPMPHLPSVVALVQLCNADLCCGAFGTNTVPDLVLNTLLNAAAGLYSTAIKPLLFALVPAVSATIMAVCVPALGWLDAFLPGLSAATLVAIEAALYAAFDSADRFLNWYADNLSDLGDVIDIVVQSNAFFRHADLSVFSSQMSIRLQGIVSFWNKTDYQGTPVLTQELHVVYVRRIINPVSQSSSYAFYNIVPDTIPHTFSSINYGIGSTNSPFYTFYVSSQFIQGYTIAA